MKKNICFAVAGFVVALLLTGFGVLDPSVRAQTGDTKRCDYTFISEHARPDIGKNGEIGYGKEWEKVVNAGWILKTATVQVYVFEKCK